MLSQVVTERSRAAELLEKMDPVVTSSTEALEQIMAPLVKLFSRFQAVERSHKEMLPEPLAENPQLYLNPLLFTAGEAFAKEVHGQAPHNIACMLACLAPYMSGIPATARSSDPSCCCCILDFHKQLFPVLLTSALCIASAVACACSFKRVLVVLPFC